MVAVVDEEDDAPETGRCLAEEGEARGEPAKDDLLTGSSVELGERADIAGKGHCSGAVC